MSTLDILISSILHIGNGKFFSLCKCPSNILEIYLNIFTIWLVYFYYYLFSTNKRNRFSKLSKEEKSEYFEKHGPLVHRETLHSHFSGAQVIIQFLIVHILYRMQIFFIYKISILTFNQLDFRTLACEQDHCGHNYW